MESRISSYIVESCSTAWLPVTVLYTSLCCRDTGACQSFRSTYIFMHANFNSTSCIVYNLLSLFLCPVHVTCPVTSSQLWYGFLFLYFLQV